MAQMIIKTVETGVKEELLISKISLLHDPNANFNQLRNQKANSLNQKNTIIFTLLLIIKEYQMEQVTQLIQLMHTSIQYMIRMRIHHHIRNSQVNLPEILNKRHSLLQQFDLQDQNQPMSLISLAKTVSPQKMLMNNFQHSQSQVMKLKLYESLAVKDKREQEQLQLQYYEAHKDFDYQFPDVYRRSSPVEGEDKLKQEQVISKKKKLRQLLKKVEKESDGTSEIASDLQDKEDQKVIDEKSNFTTDQRFLSKQARVLKKFAQGAVSVHDRLQNFRKSIKESIKEQRSQLLKGKEELTDYVN
ncbi:UNKNOWN [Stylonychia lemnae]|uniref:Uncharacterized protein n=1 Tax=Stylonychia lemnae TaxID=5949 RepID=A0A078B0E5_STYLE|nr:UNKNOWN [Stylonychia lemnae]|eukprot:CDW86867.1 UNKNOWN [Stylonychia lemnae]